MAASEIQLRDGLKGIRESAGKWPFGERDGHSPFEFKLRHALARDEFELHYQPRVCVRTRRIQGVEALLRWRDPNGGLVHAADFLPTLEGSGLIHEVGDWALEQAARDSQHWRRLGLPLVRTSVNVSAIQLRRADFAHRFLRLTRPWASGFFSLDVEIGEEALSGDAATEIKKLSLLRTAGIRVALDRFGSGQSSLGRLPVWPVDSLKIDKAFIGELLSARAGKTLVGTIISLARGLHLNVVAEGVETHEQLETLRQMGCDEAQGYLHSTAVTRDEFAQLLRHGRGWLMLPAEGAIGGRSHNCGTLKANAI